MRTLTAQEIETLASRPSVRRIAVENFLGSMPTDIGMTGNKINLLMDAASYRWNQQTVQAIRDGIQLAGRR